MTFRTWYRHYEFLVMSFGLSNTLVVFMNLIQRVLRLFLDWFMVVFINAILAYLLTVQEHELLLQAVL